MTSPAFVRFVLSVDDASYDRAAAALLDLPTSGWQEADEGATLVFWLAADMVDDPSLQEALAELRAAYPGYAERRRAQEDEWVFLHLERCA